VIKSDPARVLIADDEDDTRQFLLDFLKELGHTTIAVPNGRLAIDAARRDHPDVILLDVMMPEVSGLDVCQILKEKEETKDIPIIFVTAKGTVNDQIMGLHVGAHDYINKPYRITELAARLNAAIRVKKLQDELKQRERELQQLTRTIENDISRPLEATLQLIQGLLKQRFSRHTRDSLIKADHFVSDSLQCIKTLQQPK
jgi:DNA-binding response OmpR family regulator